VSRRAELRRQERGQVEQDPGLAAAEQALGRVRLPFAGPPLDRASFRRGEKSRNRETKTPRETKVEANRAKAKAARKARRKGRGR